MKGCAGLSSFGAFGQPHRALFLPGGQAECCMVASEFQSGGLMCQECKDGSLKVQALVRFRA